MGNFQELRVWQKAKELAVYIYKETKKGQFAKKLWIAGSNPSSSCFGSE
jgi:hypothetical protein